MFNNNRLLKKQKPTVEAWMQKHQGRLVTIVNRTCNYRDAVVEWCDCVPQPNQTTLIATYQTTLELTPVGKIRKEESQKVSENFIESDEAELLPLAGVKFESIAPATKIRQSLYPRDKDRVILPKKAKPKQLTLPLDPTSARLQQISLENGDRTVYSTDELMAGTEKFLSLEFGMISLPKPFIALLQSYNCSLDEWEAIAQLSLVLNPKQLLPIIESIPQMRELGEYKRFTNPAEIEVSQKVQRSIIASQSQSIQLSK
ncbi:hypothetical protein [Myxosarcina sp. GI1]|uniref:hypothetical protein n=1 Tax=Myxosarcina sp. GI1 TaxID=1541065 RepID=UPI00055ECCA1|nr:hypothetical protein [Myxosarcina sp. GI1]